jgi:hypothetical protein
VVQADLGKKQASISKNNQSKKAGSMAEVAEYLSSKCVSLEFKLQYGLKKKVTQPTIQAVSSMYQKNC